MTMHRLHNIFVYGQGSLIVILLAALAALFTSRASRPGGSRVMLYGLVTAAVGTAAVDLVLTGWYLFSPTYTDHIEASTASAAQYFRLGIALYPQLNSFTFHGLLYGPLLSELNSLGYFLGSGVFASKLVGWLAAWAAVGLMLGTTARAGRFWTWAAANAMALCVLVAFGNVLTSDRADSLLLLFATAGCFCVVRFSGFAALAATAALAGAAADLKLHGPLYLVPALYLWLSEQPPQRARDWVMAALVAVVAGSLGLCLPFLPENVDLAGYLDYLVLASRHGLSGMELLWNAVFLGSLWAPLVLVWLALPTLPRRVVLFAAVLFGSESVVCIIAAKPGAGLHHLIPYLSAHALLMQRMLEAGSQGSPVEARSARSATMALAVVLFGTAWATLAMFGDLLRFDLQAPRQEVTRLELERLSGRYPNGMLGVGGESSYALTYFRPWLTLGGTPQTDYGALMDLKLSGVSDAPLASALAHCQIPYLFIPKGGAPFTIGNHYGGPLFSDAVRAEFQSRYAFVEAGKDFDVYGCREKAS